MIPKFPNFKKLALSDKKIVENYTADYSPYSDFNFTSLWSWDRYSKTQLSFLNDNLVIEMPDYSSKETILSFLGKKKILNTIDMLLSYGAQKSITCLNMVPEVCLDSKITLNKYKFKDERDNFDYIFDLENLVDMKGRNYEKHRNKLKIFKKNHLDITARIVNLSSSKIRKQISQVFIKWEKMKVEQSKYYDESEFIALKRLYKIDDFKKMVCVGVYQKRQMIGFTISELLTNGYTIMHFEKCDHNYKGITEYIKQTTAKFLIQKNRKFLNAEQDLGIENLRKTKLSYGPIEFLRKYTISA